MKDRKRCVPRWLFVVVGIVLLIAIGALAYCMINAQEEKKVLVGKDILLPEALLSKEEEYVDTIKNDKGELQLISVSPKKHYYIYTLQKEDKWKKEEAEWGKDSLLQQDGYSLMQLAYNQKGILYGVIIDDNYEKPCIVVKMDNAKMEKLPVKLPESKYGGSLFVNDMSITKDEHIVLSSEENIFVSDVQYQNYWTVKFEDPASEVGHGTGIIDGKFAINNNEIYVYDAYHNNITKYSTDGKKLDTYESETIFSKSMGDGNADLIKKLVSEDNQFMMLTEDGIDSYEIEKEQTERETIREEGVLATPNVTYENFLKIEDSYYTVLQDMEQTYILTRYSYEDVPEYKKTLQIYGGVEDQRIQEAIYEYSKTNPTVQVKFTEELSQADLVVGDYGLYEKLSKEGKLKELTALTTAIHNEAELLPWVTDSMKVKNGIYGLPIAFLPYVYSLDNKKIDGTSLKDALTKYLTEQKIDVYGNSNPELITQGLYRLLEDTKRVETLMSTSETHTAWMEWMQNGWNDSISLENYLKGKNPFILQDIESFSSLALIKDIEAQTKKEFKVLDYAEIENCVAIPETCAEVSLAENFMKTLYGKKSQSLNIQDGIPVSLNVLDEMFELYESNYYPIQGVCTDEYNFFTYALSKEQCNQYIEAFSQITRWGSKDSEECQALCQAKVEEWSKSNASGENMKVVDEQTDADGILHLTVQSDVVEDTFVLDVVLPSNYDQTKKYPVIYMTDGYWNGPTYTGYQQLMKDGKLKEAIIVGIGYPKNYDVGSIRNRDLYEKPYNFLAFLKNGVIPYIDSKYSTDTTNRTLTGSSCGGYFALYALLQEGNLITNTFKNYVICSPTFIHDTDGVTLNDFEEALNKRINALPANVYMAVGGAEVYGDYISPLKNFIEKFKSRGYEGLQLSSKIYEGKVHEDVWGDAASDGIIAVLGSETK